MGASLTRARAMAMRWRWPPDSCMAVLADRGVVALAESDDEVVGIGGAGGGDDLGVGRARPAEGDVVADRAAEQMHVLAHEGDVATQRAARMRGDVGAVDQDAAGCRHRSSAAAD